MPADIKNKGGFAPPATDAASPPLPEAGLSAAFRHALAGKPAEAHLPGSATKRGQEIARLVKAGKPPAPGKGAPKKAHIGPRSGHK